MNKNTKDKINFISLLKFIIPSLVGIILFMIPIKIKDNLTIPIAYLSNLVVDNLKHILPLICVIFISLATIGSILVKIPNVENKVLKSLFDTSYGWILGRFIGMILVIMTYFKIGPEFIWSDSTGGLILYDLLPLLLSVFLFAGLFLPLLLNHGLLEFVGTLFSKIMRPLFKLPGRSSIDCITSWLGDGTIGILLTNRQYEEKFYTKKEAAIIGTSFSAVSITFSLMVITQVGLPNMFVPFYLTVSLTGILTAIIVPRIPPLSRKADTYIDGTAPRADKEIIPEGYNSLSWGLKLATDRAYENFSLKKIFKDGISNVLEMWVGVLAIVMSFGGIAVIIAEYTNVFQILGMPFIPILNLLKVK